MWILGGGFGYVASPVRSRAWRYGRFGFWGGIAIGDEPSNVFGPVSVSWWGLGGEGVACIRMDRGSDTC